MPHAIKLLKICGEKTSKVAQTVKTFRLNKTVKNLNYYF